MSAITFSISELIQKAWSQFKAQPYFLISITILSTTVGYFGDYGISFDPDTFATNFSSFGGLIMSLLSAYLTASITLIYIKISRGENVSFHDLLAVSFNKFIHYVLAVFISSIFMIFGFILLILPGFYVMARLLFVPYLVLDKDLDFISAMKQSSHMSDGQVLNLISFMFAMFFLILLGILSLLVGVLIAIPVSSLASAQLYILFSNRTQ